MLSLSLLGLVQRYSSVDLYELKYVSVMICLHQAIMLEYYTASGFALLPIACYLNNNK
jgi:hypothetical protein